MAAPHNSGVQIAPSQLRGIDLNSRSNKKDGFNPMKASGIASSGRPKDLSSKMCLSASVAMILTLFGGTAAPGEGAGIRMVMGLAAETCCFHTFSSNNLLIWLKNEKSLPKDRTS